MTQPAHGATYESLVAVAVRLSAAERLAPAAAEPAHRAIADAGAAACMWPRRRSRCTIPPRIA